MYNQIKAVISVSAITIAVMMTATIYGLGTAYADNPLVKKQEFDITVKNIHKDTIVAVSVDGLNQQFTIHGNKHQQIVKFTFSRNNGATPPTSLPIKLGDEYNYCISFKNSQPSCQRASIDTLTQPETKTLDANYIP